MKPTTVEEIQEIVRSQEALLPTGGGSKPALSTSPAEALRLEMGGLAKIIEYEPGEYTFTALAGTPVAVVMAELAKHGQYLPCDPLLAHQGATLGGVVAADTAGPLRYRFGGVRDFLIGVRFVDGAGRLVRGGGKVVKNSAGFDLAKLMVGSLGRLGILTEVSFKVFPAPAAYATLRVDFDHLRQAVDAIERLTTSPLEMDALDLEPPGRLWIRIGGLPDVLPDRLQRLESFLQADDRNGVSGVETINGAEEQTIWAEVNSLGWVPDGWGLVKIPLSLSRILVMEERLDGQQTKRRYSVGGNVAWLAWPGNVDNGGQANGDARSFFNGLDAILTQLDLAGLVILGPPGPPFLGLRSGAALLQRVKQALDPDRRFLEI